MRIRYPRFSVELRSRAVGFEMWPIIVLTFLVAASNLSGQTAEKPKAFLFDEFEAISDRQVTSKTLKLRERIREKAWSKEPLGAWIIIFHGGKELTPTRLESVVADALSQDCRDCMGFSPRVVLIRGGKARRSKIQLWLIPYGAEPPNLDKEDGRSHGSDL